MTKKKQKETWDNIYIEHEDILSCSIECETGWKELINSCLRTIKLSLDRYSLLISTIDNATWITKDDIIVHELLEDIVKDPRSSFIITRIKNKYGSLRIHYECDNGLPFVDGVIQLAESISRSTCEICGKITNNINFHPMLTISFRSRCARHMTLANY